MRNFKATWLGHIHPRTWRLLLGGELGPCSTSLEGGPTRDLGQASQLQLPESRGKATRWKFESLLSGALRGRSGINRRLAGAEYPRSGRAREQHYQNDALQYNG